MEALRDFLKGWMGKGLLILFLLPLAITGFESIVNQGDDPNAVAKVGEQNIDAATLQNSVNDRRQALLEQVNGDTSLINNDALRDQVMQNLVDRYLLIHQSNQLGFTVSDASITQLLATEKTFLDANGKFSNELFAEFLKQRGMTKEQLFDSLRQDLTVTAFSRSIMNTALFPMANVDTLINQQAQVRSVSVARINWQDFTSQVQVTDAEISAYYNQHKAELKSPERVDLNYLIVDKATLSVPAPTAQELQQQYQSYLATSGNQTEYELAMILINGNNAQATLTGLKQQLDSNKADFTALAKQYSQDEGSKNTGGNIGPITKDMFPNDYDKIMAAVKALKVGQVTAPIQTNYGYHLFKLVKINGATPPSLESVQAELTQQIATQKREHLYQQLVGKINNDAVAGASISELASRYNIAAHSLANYTKTDNTTVLNQPAVIAAVFNELALQEGSVSVGVDLKDKTVWVQPKNHRAVKALSQAEAAPVIKAKLTEQKARQLALSKANTLATQIRQRNSTQGLGIDFNALGPVSRQSPTLLPEERSAAFSTPATDTNLAVTTQTTSQGVSILVGGPINQDTNQITPELRQQTAQMVRDTIGQSQLEDYLAYLRSVTEVKIKPTTATTSQ
jgi:peptidyl-prolyl cis-trans isomerase D